MHHGIKNILNIDVLIRWSTLLKSHDMTLNGRLAQVTYPAKADKYVIYEGFHDKIIAVIRMPEV